MSAKYASHQGLFSGSFFLSGEDVIDVEDGGGVSVYSGRFSEDVLVIPRDVVLLAAALPGYPLLGSPGASTCGSTASIAHFVILFHVVEVRWRQTAFGRTRLFLFLILRSLLVSSVLFVCSLVYFLHSVQCFPSPALHHH